MCYDRKVLLLLILGDWGVAEAPGLALGATRSSRTNWKPGDPSEGFCGYSGPAPSTHPDLQRPRDRARQDSPEPFGGRHPGAPC